MYFQGFHNLPALSRPYLLSREIWAYFDFFLILLQGAFIFVPQNITHMFPVLVLVGRATQDVMSITGHGSANLSLRGGQTRFCAIPAPSASRKWSSIFYLYVFQRDPAYFGVFKASTPRSPGSGHGLRLHHPVPNYIMRGGVVHGETWLRIWQESRVEETSLRMRSGETW